MRPDGSDIRQLTFGSHWDYPASWSPDGTAVTFLRFDEGDAPTDDNIWRVQSDGTGLTRLTFDRHRANYPIWSTDGQWIAFDDVSRASCGGVECDDTWLMHPDGSDQQPLGDQARTPAGERYNSFAPDSSRIALWRPTLTGSAGVVTRPVPGGEPDVLVTGHSWRREALLLTDA